MKFKRIVAIFIMIAITLTSSIQAQIDENSVHAFSRLYLRIYANYGFLTPGSYKGQPSEERNAEYGKDGIFFKEPSYYKLGSRGIGEGPRVGAGFGIILNEFFNVGIDGEYFVANTVKMSDHRSDNKSIRKNSSVLKYQVLSIIPNLTYKAIIDPTYTNFIYGRLGMIVGFPLFFSKNHVSSYVFRDYDAQVGEPEEKDILLEYKADLELKIGIGYLAVVGGQARLGKIKRLKAFFEISGYSVSFDREKYEDSYKARREKIKNKNEDIKSLDSFSRNLIIYSKKGFNESTFTSVTGGFPNHLYTYTLPQEPIIMNSVCISIGIILSI